MKNKAVKLIIALAALAVLTGGYFGVKNYVDQQEQKETEAEADKSVTLLSGNVDELKSVKFILDKEEKTFIKTDDAWGLEGEETFPVDQDKLTNALAAYESTNAERELKDVENLEEYGLDEPLNTITFTDENDKEITIRVGMKNESTDQYYVSKNKEKNKVYVVVAASFDPFMGSLYDFAKMDTFPEISSDSVKEVEVKKQKETLKIEKTKETWTVSDENSSEKADSAKASSFASALSSMEYASFADYDCQDESKYGLKEPYAVITVDYQEEQESGEEENISDETQSTEEEPELVNRQMVLYVGDEDGNAARYVKVNDSHQIYTISQDLLSPLTEKEASDFWDLTVSYMSLNDLQSLEIQYDDKTAVIHVSRETFENEDGEEEEKKTYQLNGKEIDENTVSPFFNKMINMTAQKRMTEEFDKSKQPEMEISCHKTDGSVTEVGYYEYDANFYAVETENKVYLVNKMTVKDLFSAYEEITGNENASEENQTETEAEETLS